MSILNILIGFAFLFTGCAAIWLGAGVLVRTVQDASASGNKDRFALILLALFGAAIIPEFSVSLYVIIEAEWTAARELHGQLFQPYPPNPSPLDTDLLLGVCFASGVAILGLATGVAFLQARKDRKLTIKGILAIIYVTIFLILALIFYWLQLAQTHPVLTDDFARLFVWIFVLFWVIMFFVMGRTDDLETEHHDSCTDRGILHCRPDGADPFDSHGNSGVTWREFFWRVLQVWSLTFVASPALLIAAAFLAHGWEVDWIRIGLLVVGGFSAIPEMALGYALMRCGRIALAITLVFSATLGSLMLCLPFSLWVTLGKGNSIPLEIPDLHLGKPLPFDPPQLPVLELALWFVVVLVIIILVCCLIERRIRSWQGWILLAIWGFWVFLVGWQYRMVEWY